MRLSSSEQLELINEDGPLPEELIGFQFKNPDLVAERLGPAFVFPDAVEGEVPDSAQIVEAVLYHADEELTDFFLGPRAWYTQEVRHGEIIRGALSQMGFEPVESVEKVSPLLRFFGKAISKSRLLHDTAELAILTYADLGEVEAQTFYKQLGRALEKLGEDEAAVSVIKPIQRQEGKHKSYYQTRIQENLAKSKERWGERVVGWQKKLVSQIIERTYMPVGVQRGNTERQVLFGQVLVSLEDVLGDDFDTSETAQKIEEEVARLLGKEHALKPGVIAGRYEDCYDLALAA